MNLLEALDRLTSTKITGAYLSCYAGNGRSERQKLQASDTGWLVDGDGNFYLFELSETQSNDWIMYNSENKQVLW